VPDQFIVGVDIGSSKLCSAVAVREQGGAIRYVGHGSAPSAGLRGGEVVDVDALAGAFTRAVEEARQLVGTPVHDLVVSVSGARIEAIDRVGGLDLTSGKPIAHADVVRAIATSRGSDPAGMHTIHRVVRSLAVDRHVVDDPTGRIGSRLEVETRDYAVPDQLVDRLRQAADAAGVRIHTLIPEGVAAAAAALTDEERRSGVVLIDIGSATTDVAVYTDGDLAHVSGLPLGGHHATSDLAGILEISLEEAERLKRQHGAITGDTSEEVFEWSPRAVATLQRQAAAGYVPAPAVRSVVTARVVQIFERVRATLQQLGLSDTLRAGAVLTGGGAQLGGITDVAMAVLGMRVRIGGVLAGDGFPGIADPAVTASVGLVRYCAVRAQAPPPATPAHPRSPSAAAIVHPMVMKAFARGDPRALRRQDAGHETRDTIDVIPRRRVRPEVARGWGRVIGDWMRELVPARTDE
jgi:cell division protein FtsA